MSEPKTGKTAEDRIKETQKSDQAATQAIRSVEEAAGKPLPQLTLASDTADRQKVEAVIGQLEQVQKEAPTAQDVQAKIASDLDSTLTESERKAVDEFAGKIDIANPQHVMLYGADAQRRCPFADTILRSGRTSARRRGRQPHAARGELKTFEVSAERPRVCGGFYQRAQAHGAGAVPL